jgi:hypothetical protein
MAVPIIVTEIACASGISAEGRIEASVQYLPAEVRITVIVHTVGGDATCPGNAPVPFSVQLAEPLGPRRITGEDPPPG